jgi:excisionase family DNA binding protein
MNALAVELPPELLEQIAERAAKLMESRATATPEPWLTVEQAAAHLALSTSQLYTLCSRRDSGLPFHKEGSRSYFRASELDAWRLGQ